MAKTEKTQLEFTEREITYLCLALYEYRDYIKRRMETREDTTTLHPEDWYDTIMIDWLLQKIDPNKPDSGKT